MLSLRYHFVTRLFRVTKVTKMTSIFNASVYGERKENQRADKGQAEAFAERQPYCYSFRGFYIFILQS